MRTVERRFKRVQRKNPLLGNYPALMQAVRGQKFTRRSIYTHFKKLVDADDYDKRDANTLVEQLHKTSNFKKGADDCTFLSKIETKDEKTPTYEVTYSTGHKIKL